MPSTNVPRQLTTKANIDHPNSNFSVGAGFVLGVVAGHLMHNGWFGLAVGLSTRLAVGSAIDYFVAGARSALRRNSVRDSLITYGIGIAAGVAEGIFTHSGVGGFLFGAGAVATTRGLLDMYAATRVQRQIAEKSEQN